MRRTPDQRRGLSGLDLLLLFLVATFASGALVVAILDANERARQQEARDKLIAKLARERPVVQDLDGDGVPDSEDGDPVNARTTEPPPPAGAGAAACARRGITLTSRREGDCVDANGVGLRVVNADGAARLPDLQVGLVDLAVLDELPGGLRPSLHANRFVVARLAVTNRRRRPARFYASQFGLRVGGALVEQAPGAAPAYPDNLLSVDRALRGGERRLVRAVFELDRVMARHALRRGAVLVAQFDDVGVADPLHRIALIRSPRPALAP